MYRKPITTAPSRDGPATSISPAAGASDAQFPLGTMTLGLPEWMAIVGLATQCQESMKPLRNILAHVEIGTTPQDVYDRMTFSHEQLYKAFNLLNTLVHDIKLQDST